MKIDYTTSIKTRIKFIRALDEFIVHSQERKMEAKQLQIISAQVKRLDSKLIELFSIYELIGTRKADQIIPAHRPLQDAIKAFLIQTQEKTQEIQGELERKKGKMNSLLEKIIPSSWKVCQEQVKKGIDLIKTQHAQIIQALQTDHRKMLEMLFEEIDTIQTFPANSEKETLRRKHYKSALEEVAKSFQGKLPSSARLPTCFICYSWGNQVNAKRVHQLARFLKLSGIQVILDIWDNRSGSVPVFTSKIMNANFVILVGTPGLQEKWQNYISAGKSRQMQEKDYKGSMVAEELEKNYRYARQAFQQVKLGFYVCY